MKLGVTIFFLLTITNLFAQSNEIKREIKYTAEAGTIISTNGETPFWLRANQYGIVPNQSPIFTLRGSVSSDYKKAIIKEDQYKLSKLDWGYGLNIVGNVGKENQFLIPEAYVKAKYGAFEIYAGRRKEIFGLVDSTLSSGSYIWSGNALPMPKIQISTPNFVPLGFTKDFLSFKGNYAHGWFENSRTDVKNFYLHQKSLYFRLGKPDWKFHFYGGFNHQVQWGGTTFSKNRQLPSDIEDYFGIVIGKSLAVESDTIKFTPSDALNRAGNHLGTVDLGFDIRLTNWDVFLYRQSIFEDGSLYNLNNITDGLNGIALTNRTVSNHNFIIRKIVFEIFNSTSQGGNFDGNNINSRLRGQDNYLNNGQYFEGWSYMRNGIGTPFVLNRYEILGNPTSPYFYNNRTQAFFLGMHLTSNQKLDIYFKLSHSNNLGSYVYLLDKITSQFSGYMKVSKPLIFFKSTFMDLSISYDQGSLLKSNMGVSFGVRKQW